MTRSNAKPLHLAVDMDDVCLAMTKGLCASISEEFDVDLRPSMIDRWELHEIIDPLIGGMSWWAWMKKRRQLWANFPPIPGAMGSLVQLRKAGHKLELVTSKPTWAEASVFEWLNKHRPPFQKVTIVGVGESKAAATDADVLIDDNVGNCVGFLESGREALLFAANHNYSTTRPRKLKRVGWKDIRERFIQ